MAVPGLRAQSLSPPCPQILLSPGCGDVPAWTELKRNGKKMRSGRQVGWRWDARDRKGGKIRENCKCIAETLGMVEWEWLSNEIRAGRGEQQWQGWQNEETEMLVSGESTTGLEQGQFGRERTGELRQDRGIKETVCELSHQTSGWSLVSFGLFFTRGGQPGPLPVTRLAPVVGAPPRHGVRLAFLKTDE